eukprot:s1716_g4.t1
MSVMTYDAEKTFAEPCSSIRPSALEWSPAEQHGNMERSCCFYRLSLASFCKVPRLAAGTQLKLRTLRLRQSGLRPLSSYQRSRDCLFLKGDLQQERTMLSSRAATNSTINYAKARNQCLGCEC